MAPKDSGGVKLQKLVAAAGYASRRQAEELIAAGRVRVDGKVAELGQRVLATATVVIDGKPLTSQGRGRPASRQLIAYNKPRGQIVSRSGADTVFAHLPKLAHGRWVNVGRLDVDSEGLLLFTTDGDLANQLAHPRYGQARRYQVKSHKKLEPDQLDKVVSAGLTIAGRRVRALSFKELVRKNTRAHWYEIVVEQGRNRVVRRIFAHLQADVLRLIRVGYGRYRLEKNHPAGSCKKLPLPTLRQQQRSI